MMKRLLYILLLGLLTTACTTDSVDGDRPREGEPVAMLLHFGTQSPTLVQSRQTMPLLADESKIYNIYIYIFDAEGNKLYGRYFDGSEALASAAAVEASTDDAWYVTVPEGNSQDCSGTMKINTIARTGCKIFAISNIDAKMVNISPEKLGLVQHEDDLVGMVAMLNQRFVERSGYFPMTGELSPVDTGNLSGTVYLHRLDAKVRFWVQIGGDEIESFELKNWQLCNVSEDAYVMSREVRRKYGFTQEDSAQSYFDTETKNVEDAEILSGGATVDDTSDDTYRYGFSFYLLENNLTPKQAPTSYADRERQIKLADGTNGAWAYANDRSTYVVLTGRLVMDTNYDLGSGVVKENCTLNADVRYIIHLGDFGGGDYTDFSTERNTSYTYTVTILNAEQIRVEVESSNDDNPADYDEPSPGETGDVTVALQEIYSCDAHYTSHVMSFDQRYIKPEQVTWYVRTPFGEGKPVQVNGTDVTTGLDFRWVEFRINERWNNIYSDNRTRYLPHATRKDVDGNLYPLADGKTMYVDEVVRYLREQKMAYDAGQPSDFDSNGQIKMTAFVNEFYYDEHPITGARDLSLWKRVVNQDQMRLMHILSDAKESYDRESMVVGSSYTIQQHSIATLYNQNAEGLTSAWGMEHLDEYPLLTYSAAGTGVSENRGNTDPYNGRLNTMREWELVAANSTAFNAQVRWEDYLNLTADNDTGLLHTASSHPDGNNYNYLRWSCMSRNRDNDGDGLIDKGEVRWYLASVKQLVGIWMGADGVANSARLYQRDAASIASADEADWRQHIVSSTTSGNSNNPTLVWAEEGSSTGDLSGSTQWGRQTAWSVRCVRNLGMDDSDNASLEATPQDYVQLEGTDAVPLFNLEFMNEKSIRYLGQEGMDLVYSDELSAQNRLYWQFEATSLNAPTYEAISFPDMQAELNASLGENRFCPEGYRLPNQRELALMHLYCAPSFWTGAVQSYSRTYYSYGVNGSNPKATETNPNDQYKTGWARDSYNIYMENSVNNPNQRSTQTRCVRDVEVVR